MSENSKIGTVNCPKSAADTQEVCKQGYASGPSVTDMKQILIQLANDAVNKITETMSCSKWVANSLESSKWRNDEDALCANDVE